MQYQVLLDPNKLFAYGLTVPLVSQQLSNNNANAGGGVGHLHLPGTELVIGVPFGQRPATAKKLTGVSGAGLRGHRDALSLTREQANFAGAIGRSRWNDRRKRAAPIGQQQI